MFTLTKHLTKIGSDGSQLPREAEEWVAVLDTRSNLMWSAATNCDGKEVDGEESAAACAELRIAGFDDWREPTRLELESILDLSSRNPAIDTEYFTDAKSDWYRSSSPVAGCPGSRWVVHFYHGDVAIGHRNDRGFLRAVRSVSPAPAGQ